MSKESKQKRSATMAAVKSRGNRSTEARLRALLIRHRLRGWKMHDRSIEGVPDFSFAKNKVAIFVDGCFWHGCRQHCRMPGSNKTYWSNKIARNISRDKAQRAALRRKGWTVITVWEHEFKKSLDKLMLNISQFIVDGT